MKSFLIIIFISLLTTSCFSSKGGPAYPKNTQVIDSYGNVEARGSWHRNPNVAKRSAVQQAQKNYAHAKRSEIRGNFQSYEDSNGNVRERERYDSHIQQTSVVISSVEIINEEIKDANSFTENPKYRYTVRVQIGNGY